MSRAKAVFIPPAELVVVARSSYPKQKKEPPQRFLFLFYKGISQGLVRALGLLLAGVQHHQVVGAFLQLALGLP